MVTKREVGLCVVIVLVMGLIGYAIHGSIENYNDSRNMKYIAADQIKDPAAFKYAIDTNVGYMLSEGRLDAVRPVTFESIGGKYVYIRRELEHYTRHTRLVAHTHTDSKGRTTTTYTTEVYYSWDYVSSKKKHANALRFLDQVFTYNTIDLPGSQYIRTEYLSGSNRYVYYGVKDGMKGVLVSKTDDTPDFKIIDANFEPGYTTESLIEHYEKSGDTWENVFIFFWCLLIAGACWGFCYLDNHWLND